MPDALHLHPYDNTAQPVASRLTCWSKHDTSITLRTDSSPYYYAVPITVCQRGYGDLRLKPDGPVIFCNPQITHPKRIDVYTNDVAPINTATCKDDGPPPPGPLQATVTQDTPTDPWTVRVTITSHDPAKTIQVDWGEGDPEIINDTLIARHTYRFDDEYPIIVAYTDNTATQTFYVTVPYPET